MRKVIAGIIVVLMLVLAACAARATKTFTVAVSPYSMQYTPGQIQDYLLPEEDGVEVISTVAAGKFVSPFYDSLIAQVIVHSTDRESTIDKMLEYLGRAKITGIGN